MYKVCISLFLVFVSTVLYAKTSSDTGFKTFKSYEEAMEYITQESKKPSVSNDNALAKTPQNNLNKLALPEAVPQKPQRKKYFKSLKRNSSCGIPRMSVQEFYTSDLEFYTSDSGEQIRYKYHKDSKEFFIMLKNFTSLNVKDILLEDKKRFLIKPNLSSNNFNKKMTNIDGIKRFELSIVNSRRDKVYLVLESDKGSFIKKCDLLLQKKGGSVLHQYTATRARSNDYNLVYRVFLENINGAQ